MSDVTVKFGAQDTGLQSTIGKINADMGRMKDTTSGAEKQVGSSFGGMLKAGALLGAGVAVLGAAFKAASATVGSFGSAIDLGGRLSELKSRTGESAGNLLVLERAFDNTGVGAEKVGETINKLQKFMGQAAQGGDKQIEAMTRLGLTMNDLQGKTPTEQMKVFAEKIAGLQSPTERSALAMEVFSKSGGKLLPLLTNFAGEIEEARGELGSMPGAMDRSSEAFDKLSDKMAVIKGKAVEVAAGFIEKALPALGAFAARIAGVDAAGWGAKIMDSVIRVSDTLLGAFLNGRAAAEAIGLALETYAKGYGNLLVNGFLTAADVIKNFFTSDIPRLIVGLLGDAMSNAFAGALKLLSGTLGMIAKGLDSDLGSVFQNVIGFLTNSFKNLIGFIASDLFKALTNPLDFISGKLGSALSDSAKEGGLTFKSVFSDGISTTVGKLSDGLGATAEKYERDMSDGVSKIGQEFGRIVSDTEVSAKDFFGAKPAAGELRDKIKEIEESGKKWREEVTKGALGVKDDTKAAAQAADTIPIAMDKAEKSAKKIKEDISLAAKLMKDIDDAQKKEAVDPGGRDEKRAKDAIADGDFSTAKRAADRIKRRDEEKQIQDAFNADQDFGKSLNDLAKEQGIDTFGKTKSELRKELLEKANEAKKKGEEAKPDKGKGGKGDPPAAKEDPILGLVREIKSLLQKIEPKLPTHALGA